MEVLAFDYGDKRIGYAIASKKMRMAFAKGFIENNHLLKETVKELVVDYNPEEIVIGLPLRPDMKFTPATDKALLFSKIVFETVEKEIYLVDERYSTVYSQTSLRYAGRTIKNSKSIIDSESAKSIAEIYIHSPSWAFRFNVNTLSKSEIRLCIQNMCSDVLYLSGGKEIFSVVKDFDHSFSIYELNPYIYSTQRNDMIPENINVYGFRFSVPEGYRLCSQGAHGSTG